MDAEKIFLHLTYKLRAHFITLVYIHILIEIYIN